MNIIHQNDGFERSKKFHLLKFKALLSHIKNFQPDYFENSAQNYLEFLSNLRADEVISYGTDFFWSLVHRVEKVISENNKIETEKTYIYFLLSAFDCFFSILPIGSYIQFKGSDEEDIIFPILKISLPQKPASTICIKKINATSIDYKIREFDSIDDNGYPISIDDIPSWFKLKCETVCERITILYQKHENIYENHYLIDCCEDTIIGHLLKNKIEKSFEIIQTVDIDLYKKLTASIDYIVPYGNSIEEKYPNFAIATLKRTIFLSINLLFESETHIAECIIHEYSHCELHILQDTIPIVKADINDLEYYSPWRKDPRPLLGLVHALYIAHEIEKFYEKYLQHTSLAISDKHIVRQKIQVIIFQILIALKQIKRTLLTNFTSELIDIILHTTQRIVGDLSIDISEIPNDITEHMITWKKKNPGYIIAD